MYLGLLLYITHNDVFFFQRCFHSSDTNCGDRAGFMQGHCNVKCGVTFACTSLIWGHSKPPFGVTSVSFHSRQSHDPDSETVDWTASVTWLRFHKHTHTDMAPPAQLHGWQKAEFTHRQNTKLLQRNKMWQLFYLIKAHLRVSSATLLFWS